MKLREALVSGAERLRGAEIETADLDARVLLLDTLKKDSTFLITEPSYTLLPHEETEFLKRIEERASGKPVSYITGVREFMGLEFMVNESVLIPRPDTEILVEEAVALLGRMAGQNSGGPKVMDLCTGSGAIGISIAHYVPGCRVNVSDISPEALKIAEKNSQLLGVSDRVTFYRGDLFEAFPQAERSGYDLIASNPPYIPKEVIEGLMTDVRDFEPGLALDGGEDGLDFYRRIVPAAAEGLKSGGFLIMEIGHDQGEAVSGLMKQEGCFDDIRVLKDLAGLDRTVCGRKH